MKVGVIGGTGFYDLLDEVKEFNVSTEYGDVLVYQGSYAGKEVYFLPRHGSNHDCLAHEVNYRGNMLALKKLGINRVLSTCAVGSLNLDIPVGSFALLDQFIDLTTNRVRTYGKYSVDVSHPYCAEIRQDFLDAAQEMNLDLRPKATYVTVDGPRYETGAEIALYRSWGMDVVGMTNGTEAALARELGLCYAVVTLATDLAAGISDVPPDLEMHKNVVRDNKKKMADLLLGTIALVQENDHCDCKKAYERALAARAEKLGKTVAAQ